MLQYIHVYFCVVDVVVARATDWRLYQTMCTTCCGREALPCQTGCSWMGKLDERLRLEEEKNGNLKEELAGYQGFIQTMGAVGFPPQHFPLNLVLPSPPL